METTHTYIVSAGSTYYPNRNFGDVKFATIDFIEARDKAQNFVEFGLYDWASVMEVTHDETYGASFSIVEEMH